MSLESDVRLAVATAFDAVGDLTKDAVLHKSQSSGFDFSTGTVITTSSTRPIRVILYVSEKETDEECNTPLTKALIQDSELDLRLYDELVVGAVRYKIESYEQYTGLYLVELR